MANPTVGGSSERGRIHRYLADDHARLDSLLERATLRLGNIEESAYAEFRAGLLKHIAMEEKVLLPAAQRLSHGRTLHVASKLRLDHGALAALLVPTPTAAIIEAIRCILSAHNAIEEGPCGLYDQCEELAGTEAGAILDALRNAPEVRLAPHTMARR